MPQGALIDRKNKIIMSWSAKAGCTIAVKMFFHNMGILKDALRYHHWVHRYRGRVFYKKFGNPTTEEWNSPNYFKFKVVRNPYTRAVSSYIHAVNFSNFKGSFALFTRRLLNKRFKRPSDISQHWAKQSKEDPKIFNKIVYLENFDSDMEDVNSLTGLNYITKFISDHHLRKTKGIKFVGRKVFRPTVHSIPEYKYFYNQRILDRVTELYYDDIMAYGYNVPFDL